MRFLIAVILGMFCFDALAQVPPPPPATQAEVNAGILHNKFVAPDTLAGWTGGGGGGFTPSANQTNVLNGAITNNNVGNVQLNGSLTFTNGTTRGANANGSINWILFNQTGELQLGLANLDDFKSDGSGWLANNTISWDTSGNLTAVSFIGDGSSVTGVKAVSAARLPLLLPTDNTLIPVAIAAQAGLFSTDNALAVSNTTDAWIFGTSRAFGPLLATNIGNTISGSFTGNGGGLTNYILLAAISVTNPVLTFDGGSLQYSCSNQNLFITFAGTNGTITIDCVNVTNLSTLPNVTWFTPQTNVIINGSLSFTSFGTNRIKGGVLITNWVGGSVATAFVNTVSNAVIVSGQWYTNTTGVPLLVGANAILTETGVAGNASMSLNIQSPFGVTNIYGESTLITSLATSKTNFLSGVVPTNAIWYFTNSSSGVGDSATIIGGQQTQL